MILSRWLNRFFFFLFYLGKPRWDTGISPPELVQFLQTHPPGRALDLGCGTGTNVVTMAQRGWQVTGVDFIPTAIQAASQKIVKAGVQATVLVGDVTRMEKIHGPFDLALDIGCYHALGELEKQAYEKNLVRLMAANGHFLLYGFVRQPGGRFGISGNDIARWQDAWRLIQQQEGSYRKWPSAWYWFQKISTLP